MVGLYSFSGEAGGQVLNNFYGLLFGDTQGKVMTDSIAVYADWTFDVTDKFSIDVGARYTDEDKHAVVLNRSYSDGTFSKQTAVSANFNKTINFKNMSPKVSLDYQITPDIMVYGNASRGFKSGGYNIRAQATAVPRSAEPFKDEQVDSYEIGSKMGLLDQRLFLGNAFHNKYKDIQLSIFTAYDSNNDGKRMMRSSAISPMPVPRPSMAWKSNTNGCRPSTGRLPEIWPGWMPSLMSTCQRGEYCQATSNDQRPGFLPIAIQP